jgi:hypothetical protein
VSAGVEAAAKAAAEATVEAAAAARAPGTAASAASAAAADELCDCSRAAGEEGRPSKNAEELVLTERFRVVGIEALKDALEGVARPVLVAENARQPEQHTHALVLAARTHDFRAVQLAVATYVNAVEGIQDILLPGVLLPRSRRAAFATAAAAAVARFGRCHDASRPRGGHLERLETLTGHVQKTDDVFGRALGIFAGQHRHLRPILKRLRRRGEAVPSVLFYLLSEKRSAAFPKRATWVHV